MSDSKRPSKTARLVSLGLHTYWRFARGMTLGVRAVVLNDQAQVFLIRHTYVSGWHLPGGGVETGETALESLTRELREYRVKVSGLRRFTIPRALPRVPEWRS